MAEAILEKIPVEKRWEMATQSFANGCMGYIQVLLDIVGKEKLAEIESKMWSEGMRMSFPDIHKGTQDANRRRCGCFKLNGCLRISIAGTRLQDGKG